METAESFIKRFVELLGFSDYKLEIDSTHRRGELFIHSDEALVREQLPVLIDAVNHLLQLVARKRGEPPVFLDVNNYRRERERLITELARAAARKALATKGEVPLPAMNSYERRLAHLELAHHPEVTTESFGKGKGRYVVVKPITEPPAGAQSSDTA